MGCLFTPLIVSFDVQKCLILMTARFWWPKILNVLLLSTWPLETLRLVDEGWGQVTDSEEWASPGRVRGQNRPMDEGTVSLPSHQERLAQGLTVPLKPLGRGGKRQQILWNIHFWVSSSDPQEVLLFDCSESSFFPAFLSGGDAWKASFSGSRASLHEENLSPSSSPSDPRRTLDQPQVT